MTDAMRSAIETILRGFDEGVFVRSTDNDLDPAWAIKLFPFIQALAVAQRGLAESGNADILRALKNYGADVECGACMEVAFTGVTTNEHTCKYEKLADIVEEFVGYWHLNREQSVNKTYDYVDKVTKRMRAAREEQR